LHISRDIAPPLVFEHADASEARAPADRWTHTANGAAFARWDAAWRSPTKSKVYCTFQARGHGTLHVALSKAADVAAPNGQQAYVASLLGRNEILQGDTQCTRLMKVCLEFCEGERIDFLNLFYFFLCDCLSSAGRSQLGLEHDHVLSTAARRRDAAAAHVVLGAPRQGTRHVVGDLNRNECCIFELLISFFF
jgi:hypothetical protein